MWSWRAHTQNIQHGMLYTETKKITVFSLIEKIVMRVLNLQSKKVEVILYWNEPRCHLKGNIGDCQ
jgi:hypothetical protein